MVTEKNTKTQKTADAYIEDDSVDGTVKNKSIIEILCLRGDEILTDPGAKWLVGHCHTVEEAVDELASLFRAFVQTRNPKTRSAGLKKLSEKRPSGSN